MKGNGGSVNRRYLPALRDHRSREGAFATQWEGWINPRDRVVGVSGRINKSNPNQIDKVEVRVGCYAILYSPGGENDYVAYIGFSRQLRTEIKSRYRNFEIEGSSFPFTVEYIPNTSVAQELERDLIRYYAPPWNIRFS
jgi:hypothetical protein